MSEPKASMSFEKRRKAMLSHITSVTKGNSIKREISFLNEDAPKFIRAFNAFEKESQEIQFIAK